MAQLLQSESEVTDPRILRSRRMLMDSLAKLLIKKAFDDISIQEIADEATLNRATFYLHYPDKNALLQAMTESRFRDLIERHAITFTDCHGALRAIALGCLRLSCRDHRLSQSVGSDVARRLDHPGRRGHV
jgi:AcrR family transcriptional regulator